MKKSKKKYAFYLSGGGVAAIESIGGMIDALDKEWKILPDYISSCSGGGIPYHLKHSGVNLIEFFKTCKVSDYIKMRTPVQILLGKPVFDTSNLKLILEKLTGFTFNRNHHVNITSNETKRTYYVPANSRTVLASASIPEVFDPQLVDAPGFYIQEKYNVDGTISLHKVNEILSSELCYDGGVSDLIPTPLGDEYNYYDKMFILICNDSPSENYNCSRLTRVIDLILQTMTREYNQVLKDYYQDPKVVILKPPAIESSLLDWSKDYRCYYNAYNYVKNLKLKDIIHG